MNWKWLFIYPEQHVASVNQVAFPVDTPVHFVITSDSVMNSFFIPQIGSQIYAMTGMKANLNLMANEVGTYHGLSANFSGPGFSGMGFDAKALPSADFSNWVATAAQSSDILDATTYPALKEPSEDVPVHYYSQVADGLFDGIVDSYMGMAMDKSEKTKADSEKGAE
jgi:cytochrome o ubiquinol oxidase subunit 2